MSVQVPGLSYVVAPTFGVAHHAGQRGSVPERMSKGPVASQMLSTRVTERAHEQRGPPSGSEAGNGSLT